ncbi:hypothetical protein JZ785_11135 [Alicyclobacillus curvatus]|jgi:hypothetical protein|nr:hypothetical protein JZ785_11135 [Alicyclobacillus curvatus]
MKQHLVIGIVSSVLVAGVGVNADIDAHGSYPATKQIATPATPHTVPPEFQGKPALPNPDPGIQSPFTSKTTDIGFTADIKSSKDPDPGMTPQYPPLTLPPQAHPATKPQNPNGKS